MDQNTGPEKLKGLLPDLEYHVHIDAHCASGIDLPNFTMELVDDQGRGKLLGRGGFASVYKAKVLDEKTGHWKSVAAKYFHVFRGTPQIFNDEREVKLVVQEYLKEVQLARIPDHENLMKILGIGWKMLPEFPQVGEVPAIILMELGDDTLKHRMRDFPLGINFEQLDVLTQLLNAVTFLHRLGVVHRDIKPGNILIGQDEKVKLSDFGLVRVLAKLSRTMSNGAGTPFFAAPEICVEDEEYSLPIDIYSVAVTALELIFGPRLKGSHRERRIQLVECLGEIRVKASHSLSFAEEDLSADEMPSSDEVADDVVILEKIEECLAEDPSQWSSAGELFSFFSDVLKRRKQNEWYIRREEQRRKVGRSEWEQKEEEEKEDTLELIRNRLKDAMEGLSAIQEENHKMIEIHMEASHQSDGFIEVPNEFQVDPTAKSLGTGSYASVYNARLWNSESSKWRDVAAKYFHLFRLPELYFNNSVEIKQHHNEVPHEIEIFNLHLKEKHPNVIRLLGIVWTILPAFPEVGEVPAMFLMEAAERDLSHFIEHVPRGLDTEKLDILRQILCGLSSLHSHNVIHRDLKPANILLCKDRKVKIGGFGLARCLEGVNTGDTLTKVGTPCYAAPEVFSGHYGLKADMFSFGATALQLISKEVPCDFEEKMEQMEELIERCRAHPAGKLDLEEVQRGSPTDSESERRISDLELLMAIKRCLSRDPSERPAAEELELLFKNAYIDRLETMNRWAQFCDYQLRSQYVSVDEREESVFEALKVLRVKADEYNIDPETAANEPRRMQRFAQLIVASTDVILAIFKTCQPAVSIWSIEVEVACKRLEKLRQERVSKSPVEGVEKVRFSDMDDAFFVYLLEALQVKGGSEVFGPLDFLSRLKNILEDVRRMPRESWCLVSAAAFLCRCEEAFQFALGSYASLDEAESDDKNDPETNSPSSCIIC